MTTIGSASAVVLTKPDGRAMPDQAELAALAFLARYSGRTSTPTATTCAPYSNGHPITALRLLKDTRAHREMYRASMEECGLAASTIDRLLSTACGYYRFAHIHGRIASNPAQYAHRPKVHPSERRGLDRGELGDMAIERGHRVLRVVGKGNKPALIPLVPRTARTIDLAVGKRQGDPILWGTRWRPT